MFAVCQAPILHKTSRPSQVDWQTAMACGHGAAIFCKMHHLLLLNLAFCLPRTHLASLTAIRLLLHNPHSNLWHSPAQAAALKHQSNLHPAQVQHHSHRPSPMLPPVQMHHHLRMVLHLPHLQRHHPAQASHQQRSSYPQRSPLLPRPRVRICPLQPRWWRRLSFKQPSRQRWASQALRLQLLRPAAWSCRLWLPARPPLHRIRHLSAAQPVLPPGPPLKRPVPL